GGRVFNVTASGDPGNDGNASNDRPPYLGRNTYRGPNLLTWDLRLSKDVPLGTERIRLRFIAEAFNLTNRANFNGIQVGQLIHAGGIFRPTTNFGFAQSNFDPRIMQLAIKLVF
ncbi:MAG: hypothetical protein HYZ37_06345, partial [Candidatus Solibacter usitatus]|nr:hypothetical protein [Candidatus Solibacter usitatus]